MSAHRHSYLETTALDAFDARTAALEDPRPHPTEPALVQLGRAVMSEVLDLVLDTALEDHVALLCEGLLGGLHTGLLRVERAADRARDELARLLRDFDGSEVADTDLQAARRTAEAADVAAEGWALVRDAAAEAYGSATGETWSPWRASARPVRTTAAQLDAREALRAMRERRVSAAAPGGPVVILRGAPGATAPEDGMRIFDALNWARGEWPDMVLATTGAPGAERLATSWARQKGVRLVLARPDFQRHGRAAPFRANDDLLALEPACLLALPASLSGAEPRAFGPALNLLQQARARGVRCVRIARKPPG